MNTSALPPSPATTLAIILGASEWPNSPGLHSSKAFEVAGHGFKDYILSRQGLGLPQANVCNLFNKKTSASDQLNELASFLKRRTRERQNVGQAARDVLVYFVGHGSFPDSSDDFYLLPCAANESILRGTGIYIQALADALKAEARLLRWYVILDCCYSASALRVFMGGPDQVAAKKVQEAFHRSSAPRKGVALFCSSDRDTPSRLLPDESCTTFSRALLNALENGESHYPSHMSLRHVSELTKDRLSVLVENPPHPNLHSDQREWADIADIPFFPNPASKRSQKERTGQTKEHRYTQAFNSQTLVSFPSEMDMSSSGISNISPQQKDLTKERPRFARMPLHLLQESTTDEKPLIIRELPTSQPFPQGNTAFAPEPTGREKTWAAFSYLFPVLPLLAPIVFLIIYLVGRKSRFIRFHLIHALLLFLIFVMTEAVAILLIAWICIHIAPSHIVGITNIAIVASFVTYCLIDVAWLVFSAQGEYTELPFIGRPAKTFASKVKIVGKKVSESSTKGHEPEIDEFLFYGVLILIGLIMGGMIGSYYLIYTFILNFIQSLR